MGRRKRSNKGQDSSPPEAAPATVQVAPPKKHKVLLVLAGVALLLCNAALAYLAFSRP